MTYPLALFSYYIVLMATTLCTCPCWWQFLVILTLRSLPHTYYFLGPLKGVKKDGIKALKIMIKKMRLIGIMNPSSLFSSVIWNFSILFNLGKFHASPHVYGIHASSQREQGMFCTTFQPNRHMAHHPCSCFWNVSWIHPR